MAFEATKAQENAINAQGSILVSAAAGSGKTAVLVERVVKMLTDRKNPVFADRMLIVTFTNAAAAEMLSRIESRLYEELENDSDSELLKRQCYLIKSADICTIDSFCIRLVRENFALCGIEPDFKVTDDGSLYSIRKEILTDIIGERIRANEKATEKLLNLSSCRFGEEPLAELMDKIYISAKKTASVKGFINALSLPYNAPFGSDHIWYKYAFSFASDRVRSMLEKSERLAEAALYSENTDKAVLYSESVANIVSSIKTAVDGGAWDTVFSTVRSAEIGRVPNKSTEEMKYYKEQIVRDIKGIAALFYDSCDAVFEDIKDTAAAVNLLLDMVKDYDRRLFARLKEENKFSFDDIEQLALTLLCNEDENGNLSKSEYAENLIGRYDRVLVDEFQDVNDLQDTLFDILSNKGKNLFVVGDVKQSIYAFRGSNPDIFLAKKNAYAYYTEENADKKRKILLSDNFRSREGVCTCVNFFFEKLMSAQVGGLVYNDDEKLNCKAKFPENGQTATDLIVIDKVDDDSGDSLIKSEAIAIADYIENTINKGEILRDNSGTLRKAQYGDFCILLAALKDKSGVIADELNKRLIPAKVSDGEFFNSTEIVTLRALMSVIDNPKNDLELLRLLMSPLYCFSAEDLANIRANSAQTGLFSALCSYAVNDNKSRAFLDNIDELRRLSCILPLDGFISYIIDKTDMMNIFYSLPDGDIRAQNIMRFMKLSEDYASGFGGSIYGFLKYIESLPENSVKPSASKDDQYVKIMSVHGSKGLQFPICIVAGLSSKINTSDAISACIYSKEYGIGFKYLNKDILDKKENLGHKVLNAESRKEIARERLRLLYVAMTRAEEKLCLVCSLRNAQSGLFKAAQASDFGRGKINGDYIIGAQNSADYILAAAITHPDSDILRKTAECNVTTASVACSMNTSFVDASKIKSADEKNAKEQQPNDIFSEEISKNIEYKYPFEKLSSIPSKVSVSLLANKAENDHFAMTDRPSFMQKGRLDAAGRGTALHKALQFIKFGKAFDIDAELKRLSAEKRITAAEYDVIDKRALARFFESNLYKRICNSNNVKREMRFLTEMPVSFLNKESSDIDDRFIVQGAVDLCFLEDAGVVVVDFKTDFAENAEELKRKYNDQLSIYAVACEKIFGVPVKEKIIYSFHLSEQIGL